MQRVRGCDSRFLYRTITVSNLSSSSSIFNLPASSGGPKLPSKGKRCRLEPSVSEVVWPPRLLPVASAIPSLLLSKLAPVPSVLSQLHADKSWLVVKSSEMQKNLKLIQYGAKMTKVRPIVIRVRVVTGITIISGAASIHGFVISSRLPVPRGTFLWSVSWRPRRLLNVIRVMAPNFPERIRLHIFLHPRLMEDGGVQRGNEHYLVMQRSSRWTPFTQNVKASLNVKCAAGVGVKAQRWSETDECIWDSEGSRRLPTLGSTCVGMAA
ncbi:hypothetical protein BJV77DRAFT_962877 [Russula vinacea]|nr:hypothetical protein BJV77DRAFT_962877 [Russula vinacea]